MSNQTDDEGRVWHVAGPAKVDDDGTNEIYFPPDLVKSADIIRPDVEKVYWYYEQMVGYHLIGNARLKQSQKESNQRQPIETKFYEFVDDTKLTPLTADSDKTDESVTSYRNVVPKRFFEDFTGQTGRRDPVPEKAQMEYGTTYYCIYHDEMAEGDIRSCYVLDSDEFAQALPRGAASAFETETDDDDGPSLGDTPRFS